jgi:hypothetical protein
MNQNIDQIICQTLVEKMVNFKFSVFFGKIIRSYIFWCWDWALVIIWFPEYLACYRTRSQFDYQSILTLLPSIRLNYVQLSLLLVTSTARAPQSCRCPSFIKMASNVHSMHPDGQHSPDLIKVFWTGQYWDFET